MSPIGSQRERPAGRRCVKVGQRRVNAYSGRAAMGITAPWPRTPPRPTTPAAPMPPPLLARPPAPLAPPAPPLLPPAPAPVSVTPPLAITLPAPESYPRRHPGCQRSRPRHQAALALSCGIALSREEPSLTAESRLVALPASDPTDPGRPSVLAPLSELAAQVPA